MLLQRAGAVRAMELDINPEWVSYMWYIAVARWRRDPAQDARLRAARRAVLRRSTAGTSSRCTPDDGGSAPARRRARARPSRPAEDVVRGPVRLVRPRQWLKNVLVVGAPLAAGRILEGRVAPTPSWPWRPFAWRRRAPTSSTTSTTPPRTAGHARKRLGPSPAVPCPRRAALAAAVVLAVAALAWPRSGSPRVRGADRRIPACSRSGYTLRLRREPVIELVVVAAGFVLRGAAAASRPASR